MGETKLPVGPALARVQARITDTFLCGPVPWPWLTVAAGLPGKALHVGLALWYRAGRQRKQVGVDMSLSAIAREFGFHRTQASRGLEELEEARLVSVERAAGRKPRVTILEVPRRTTSGPDRTLNPTKETSP
jgi:hypothetical protein